ncbi:MAG: PqqD family peptide modification chaperone [Alphaproteobacteria bacterium]|nr:PqqD family peptide modification chaperone [Alphaproteobacteria bacterium]MCW5742622.1 PqqD family peptide modification chaperone [Alphaproteobacteria bacterium]
MACTTGFEAAADERDRPAFAGARPSLHFVEGEGLLLDPDARRLYRLNAGAALVWSLLEEESSLGSVKHRLRAEHGLSSEEATRLVGEVFRQWRTRRPATAAAISSVRVEAAPALSSAVREHYSLRDVRFRVAFASAALRESVQPLLSNWATAPGPAIDIAMVERAQGVKIVVAGHVIGGAPSAAQAAVALRAVLTQLAVEHCGGLCVVHAGALAVAGGALLLPGHAGSGKSTLSAGLAASGFDMMSDDTTLLTGDPPGVAALPTGLCVKRGSYAVLASRFPMLAALPEWSRPDGVVAKYLRPGRDVPWAADEPIVPVRWLVFPHYHPAHETRLVPLSRARALERLLPEVYCLSGTLDAANLDALIAWIGRVECYELPLSSLDAAVAEVRQLCR